MIYSRDGTAPKLVYLIEARPAGWLDKFRVGQPVDRHAAAGGRFAVSDDVVIDVHGLTKRFGKKLAVPRIISFGSRRRGLGLSRAQRFRQDHDHPHVVRPADARCGAGTCLGYDIRRKSEQIKREVGYMTQRFSFWEDLTIRENLDFVARVYRSRTPASGRRNDCERLG